MTFNVLERIDIDNPLPVDDKGASNIFNGCVSMSGTPTLLVPARAGRKAVMLSRDDLVILLIGSDNTLAVENGYRPFTPSLTVARIDTSADIYGMIPVTDDTTMVVSFLELF